MKKKLLYVIAAVCLIAGGALSGTLLSAGAATKSKSSSAQPAGTFKSNEDPAHEKAESAAREKAEDSGQLPPGGPGGHDGHFVPNEDPAHEKAESAAREAQEQQWKSPGGSSTAPQTGSSSQQ